MSKHVDKILAVEYEPCDICKKVSDVYNCWRGAHVCPECTADLIRAEMEEVDQIILIDLNTLDK